MQCFFAFAIIFSFGMTTLDMIMQLSSFKLFNHSMNQCEYCMYYTNAFLYHHVSKSETSYSILIHFYSRLEWLILKIQKYKNVSHYCGGWQNVSHVLWPMGGLCGPISQATRNQHRLVYMLDSVWHTNDYEIEYTQLWLRKWKFDLAAGLKINITFIRLDLPFAGAVTQEKITIQEVSEYFGNLPPFSIIPEQNPLKIKLLVSPAEYYKVHLIFQNIDAALLKTEITNDNSSQIYIDNHCPLPAQTGYIGPNTTGFKDFSLLYKYSLSTHIQIYIFQINIEKHLILQICALLSTYGRVQIYDGLIIADIHMNTYPDDNGCFSMTAFQAKIIVERFLTGKACIVVKDHSHF